MGWFRALLGCSAVITGGFYRRTCAAHLQPVLDTLLYLRQETEPIDKHPIPVARLSGLLLDGPVVVKEAGDPAPEPEVRDWLEALPTSEFATAAFYVDLVADRGPLLGEPYTRQLDGKLRELRFHLDGRSVQVTYWIAPGRRIVLLTVFVKMRMRESAEVERARRAMARCLAREHGVEDDGG